MIFQILNSDLWILDLIITKLILLRVLSISLKKIKSKVASFQIVKLLKSEEKKISCRFILFL